MWSRSSGLVAGTSAPGGQRSSHLLPDYGVSGRLFTTHSSFLDMRLGPTFPDLSFVEKEEERLKAEV